MKKNMIILIAEDDAGHFQLIKRNMWLTCIDYDIIPFKDGQEILDFLSKNENDIYDEKRQYVLLLDIRMPKVDGIEVLKRIKENEKLRRIPVVMLTTTSEANMIEKCYELGCSFYMVKPVDYHSFMETVKYLSDLLSLESIRLC